MKNLFLTLITLTILSFSCNSSDSASSEKQVTEEQIQKIIEDLKESNGIDKERVKELIENIDLFAKENVDNKNTPKHLELKAKYLGALGKNKKALEVYNIIYSKYSDYENSSDALFMMAFIYENNVGDKEKAKEYYQKYLTEFPSSDFAKDAKFSIDNIDKTPEELMEMFKKNAEESAKTTEQ